jgi:outer membrane lipase/esterase
MKNRLHVMDFLMAGRLVGVLIAALLFCGVPQLVRGATGDASFLTPSYLSYYGDLTGTSSSSASSSSTTVLDLSSLSLFYPVPDTAQTTTASSPTLDPYATPIAPALLNTTAAGNVNATLTGIAIVTTCATGANGAGEPNNVAFQQDCDLIVGGGTTDTSGSAQALTDIAASQINAQNSAAMRTANMGVAVISGRLERLRLASGLPAYGAGTGLVAANLFGQTGGGASSDVSFGRFGGFLNGQYVNGNEDQTAYQPGYDFNGWSLSGGIDYRITDELVAGGYIQYWDGNADFDNNGGRMDTNSWGGALYATYFLPSGLYFDGLIGYASNNYDLKRNVVYTINSQTANQVAKSEPNADLWNFSLGTGYTIYRGDLSFTPLARLTYLNNSVDAYSEQMSNPAGVGGSMAQAIGSQTYESFRSDLGFQIAKAISTPQGVFSPQLSFAWVHEYLNSQEQVGTRFVNDINNTPFYVLTNKPDHNYFNLGVGVAAQFAQGRSGFISYNTLLGYDGVTYNAVNAGVRIEF